MQSDTFLPDTDSEDEDSDYESENGVILTPGNSDGFLPPEYFKEIVFTKK